MVPTAYPSHHPKRHLDRFSRFLWVPNTVLYNALSMGMKTPKLPFLLYFVTLPEEDRATAIGNMHRTRKPRKGAAVIAASMHGFANCRKFKSPDRLTLTLDGVKVTPTYTVRVGLPAYPTM